MYLCNILHCEEGVGSVGAAVGGHLLVEAELKIESRKCVCTCLTFSTPKTVVDVKRVTDLWRLNHRGVTLTKFAAKRMYCNIGGHLLGEAELIREEDILTLRREVWQRRGSMNVG
jgi:hypothetical protein